MFLEPRFKFYFDDAHVAEETKRKIIALVPYTFIIWHKMETVLTHPSASSYQPSKSIRQDFENKMQGIQPEGVSQSRAIVEVLRYYDDKKYVGPIVHWSGGAIIKSHI